jgi:metallo-beta-lactamase family protein
MTCWPTRTNAHRSAVPLAGRVGKVRLVHGEPESATALAAAMRVIGFADVAAPGRGESEVLGAR